MHAHTRASETSAMMLLTTANAGPKNQRVPTVGRMGNPDFERLEGLCAELFVLAACLARVPYIVLSIHGKGNMNNLSVA
jgi:hypothetical protein